MRRLVSAMDRRMPSVAFARHVPPAQIVTRIVRRLRTTMLGPKLTPLRDYAVLAVGLPAPPVPINVPAGTRAPVGWRFTFLGRTLDMHGDIDWAAPSLQPVDQLWRMNLHYMEYLPALAAEDAADAIAQWIAANPVQAAGALSGGWNAYALSIRVVEWLRFLSRHADVVGAAQKAAIDRSLREQVGFLRDHVETDIGGNHLVRNVRALLWAARCGHGTDVPQIRRHGQRLLDRVLSQQILSDGMHFELSPAYHCQVLGDLIDCQAALGQGTHRMLDDAIDRMLEAAAIVTHRDGFIAQFGDAGLTMAPPLAALAEAAGRTCALVPGVLPQAGFGAWHGPQLSVVAKFGRVAADTLPAHGHCDHGSFELSGPTGRIVVDQGVYSYVAGPRRAVSRTAESHNLTVAGDREMAHFFSDFRLGRRPNTAGFAACDGDRLTVDSRHDGYSADRRPLLLTRRLEARDRTVVITDSLSRSGSSLVDSRFLLHPRCRAEPTPDGFHIHDGDGLALMLAGHGDWRAEPAEWWPDMGVSRPTVRLICDWSGAATENQFSFSLSKTVSAAS